MYFNLISIFTVYFTCSLFLGVSGDDRHIEVGDDNDLMKVDTCWYFLFASTTESIQRDLEQNFWLRRNAQDFFRLLQAEVELFNYKESHSRIVTYFYRCMNSKNPDTVPELKRFLKCRTKMSDDVYRKLLFVAGDHMLDGNVLLFVKYHVYKLPNLNADQKKELIDCLESRE